MKMRAISLLVLLLAVATAPAALAHHCRRCLVSTPACVSAANYGFEICYYISPISCVLENPCGNHLAAAPAPLASEYQVAAVERLDDEAPQPKAEEVLVASADTHR